MSRTAARLLPLVALLFLLAANPATEPQSDDLIRRANAAFESGEIAAAQGDSGAARRWADDADRLYASAEELTADPGLVAFNRAAVLFRREKFAEAGALYHRVLKDAECPPERAAAANYNRGTCLLRVGGSSRVYLDAARHLALAHDSGAADPPLKARARDNLELAKTLWKKAYDEEKKAGQKPENPNDYPNQDRQDGGGPRSGDQDQQPGTIDPDGGNNNQATTQPVTQPNGTTSPSAGQTTTQGAAPTTTPESGYTEPADVQPRSPEATRKILRDAAIRLQREQRILDDSLYTSQLGVRDR